MGFVHGIFPLGLMPTPVYQSDLKMNSNLEAQVNALYLSLRYLRETPAAYVQVPDKDMCSYEWDVYLFGCLFYEVNSMLRVQSFAY
jgi:hypothetical protein